MIPSFILMTSSRSKFGTNTNSLRDWLSIFTPRSHQNVCVCTTCILILVIFLAPSAVHAQVGGITIDADGLVTASTPLRLSRTAVQKKLAAYSEENLPADIITTSDQRVISLKQLDETLTQTLQQQQSIPETLLFLAGLQRIEAIVIDRDHKDLKLIGPAEGFGPAPSGRMHGITTSRPPIQLDDLVTALRSVAAGEREIGVSIDPTNQNMSQLQNYLRSNSSPATTAIVQRRYQAMRTILGNQVISLWGIPETTHFAQVLVEADLRMKRIALGLEPSGSAKVRSHLSMLKPQGNSLQRWWFMPYYESIETNAERTLYVIKGPRAQLMSQEEIADTNGQRSDAPFTRRSTQKFAEQFTENFDQLAEINPTFAELQSLYDLALVASIARREGFLDSADPAFPTLLKDQELPVRSYPVPKLVQSSATYRRSSRGTMLGLIGGVTINMAPVIENTIQRADLDTSSWPFDSSSNSWWQDSTRNSPTSSESSPRSR